MNAASRMFNQGVISRGWAFSFLLKRTHVSIMLLAIAVLTSALSIVYVTNASRCLNASFQQSLGERDQMHVQWGQLLLEKSTWMTQAHVQQVAEEKLGMAFPTGKSVVIVNSKN
jgi:cell division protein FtsL